MDSTPASAERPAEPPAEHPESGSPRFRFLAQQAQAAYVRERAELNGDGSQAPE